MGGPNSGHYDRKKAKKNAGMFFKGMKFSKDIIKKRVESILRTVKIQRERGLR